MNKIIIIFLLAMPLNLWANLTYKYSCVEIMLAVPSIDLLEQMCESEWNKIRSEYYRGQCVYEYNSQSWVHKTTGMLVFVFKNGEVLECA